jgi:hypothetical protein
MDFHRCASAIVKQPTTTHSDDRSFLGFLFGGVRNDDAALGDFFSGGRQ